MAHNIHEDDNFGFIGDRKRIWHGLGKQIQEGLSAQEAFEQIGLGWRTRLLEVQAIARATVDVNGQPVPDTVQKIIACPEHRLHVRADNLKPLGMVSKGYKPFENQDLAKFADALAGSDAAVRVETAGSLYGGRRIFTTVRLPEIVRATAQDELDIYVVLANGHGGFAAFSVYPTSVRVVCDNTLRLSERDIGRGLRFIHTGDFDEKLKAARTVLGIAQRETEKFQEKVTALVRTGLSEGQARHFMEQAWSAAFGKIGDHLDDDAKEKLLAKRHADVTRQLELMNNERNTLPGIRDTAWSALNAVTEWHDHERGRFRKVGESEGRLHSNLFGTASLAKSRAMSLALALV